MIVRLSAQATEDLRNVHKLDRPRLFRALEILQYDECPNGVFEDFTVDSRPVDVLDVFKPRIYRLSVDEPPSICRVFYFFDKAHDVIYIVFVRHRDRAYPMSMNDIETLEDVKRYIKEIMAYRKAVGFIMWDYFEHRRWEDGC